MHEHYERLLHKIVLLIVDLDQRIGDEPQKIVKTAALQLLARMDRKPDVPWTRLRVSEIIALGYPETNRRA